MIKSIWAVIIVILVIGSFYWFHSRPSKIKRTCTQRAIEISVKSYPPYASDNMIYEPNTTKRTLLQQELQGKEYQNCLNENGL